MGDFLSCSWCLLDVKQSWSYSIPLTLSYTYSCYMVSSREKGPGSKSKITRATLFEFWKYLAFISVLDFVIRGIGLICLKPPGKGCMQDFLLCCNKTIIFWVTEKTGWMHSSMTQDYISESELYLLTIHAWLCSSSMDRFLLPGKRFWFPRINKKLFFPQAMMTSQHSFIWLLWAWFCVFFPSAP